MKYTSPTMEVISFHSEDILGYSDSPILTPDPDNTPKEPAKDFGDIEIIF